jgi:hypothetical protein
MPGTNGVNVVVVLVIAPIGRLVTLVDGRVVGVHERSDGRPFFGGAVVLSDGALSSRWSLRHSFRSWPERLQCWQYAFDG